jgi:hypothetical protein
MRRKGSHKSGPTLPEDDVGGDTPLTVRPDQMKKAEDDVGGDTPLTVRPDQMKKAGTAVMAALMKKAGHTVMAANAMGRPGRQSTSAVWGTALSKAMDGNPVETRVKNLQTLMGLADSRSNKVPMWRDNVENGTREVLLAAATKGQPEMVREKALRTLASLAVDEENQHGMWHNDDLAAAVRLGAADGQPETIRRASLWTIVNLSVDKPTNCQPMWADDAEGGVRAALLRSAGEGQLVELRVRRPTARYYPAPPAPTALP